MLRTEAFLKQVQEQLPREIQAHPAVRHVLTKLGSFVAARVGEPLYDFSASTHDGDTISTQAHRGNYLLLQFWSTHCKSCLLRNEELESIVSRLQIQNIHVFGVQLDYADMEFNVDLLQKRIESHWSHGVVFAGQQTNEVMRFYQADSLPASFFISPFGKILMLNPDSIETMEVEISKDMQERLITH